MAGNKVNKNSSRGSGVLGGNKGPSIAAEVRLIQPLDSGRYVRVMHAVAGRSVHDKTGSAAVAEAVRLNVDAGFGDRIAAELDVLEADYPGAGFAALRAGVFAPVELAEVA